MKHTHTHICVHVCVCGDLQFVPHPCNTLWWHPTILSVVNCGKPFNLHLVLVVDSHRHHPKHVNIHDFGLVKHAVRVVGKVRELPCDEALLRSPLLPLV